MHLSYAGGASQAVEVLAKRSLRTVRLHYRINGGAVQTAGTGESPDGERFGGNNAYDVYYHYLRSKIGGIAVGDRVEYWFSGRRRGERPRDVRGRRGRRRRRPHPRSRGPDGASNVPGYASTSASTPNFLSAYESALTANGISYDVYDVDARGRTAPDHLGVLSHYESVVWYTGNDLVTREPGGRPATSRGSRTT